MKKYSKQQEKWISEIKDLESKIPQMEGYLKEHQDKLKNDTTIDFYEIKRRNESGASLIKQISNAKKRIEELKSKL